MLVGLFDLALMHKKKYLQILCSIGFLLTAFPYGFILLSMEPKLPSALTLVSIAVIGFFFVLLIYSVFLEIYLHTKTVKQTRKPSETLPPAYKKGTYSFSRHPGFIWYTVINILISAIFWNLQITLICTGLTLCNLVLISMEDIFLFPRMFVD